MMDDQDPQVELVERVSLNPHEMIIPTNLEKRLSKLRKIGFYKPIIVDSETMVILDGHHKWNAAATLGLIKVPVLKVEYLQSNSIEVETWPDCGRQKSRRTRLLVWDYPENSSLQRQAGISSHLTFQRLEYLLTN